MGFKVDVLVFSEDVLVMDGKIVDVWGYIIFVEGYKGYKEFIFLAYFYNMCFFCGGVGLEMVMEVFVNEFIEYIVEFIIICGKLEFNVDDINCLIYVLIDVVKVEEDC